MIKGTGKNLAVTISLMITGWVAFALAEAGLNSRERDGLGNESCLCLKGEG